MTHVHGLGRIPSPPDPRDLTLGDVALRLGVRRLPKQRTWESLRVLDQGDTGHCVGFGCAGWGIAEPVRDTWTNDDGHRIYRAAKVIDGEPDGENGSFVRSGLQALQQLGRVDTYFWLTGVGAEVDMDALVDFLLGTGTVIVGTDWTADMFNPDADGFIAPTGAAEGGHCYLLRGAESRDVIRIRNSWGDSWGKNGDAFVRTDDMKRLLDGAGEACAAIEKPLG